MENPFKSILKDEKLPDTIKSKVLDEIALIKLAIEMADLVTVKYPDVFVDILSQKKKSTEDKVNNKEKK